MNESESYEREPVGALERARRRLYAPAASNPDTRQPESHATQNTVPSVWEKEPNMVKKKHTPLRLAVVFFGTALVFFFCAAGFAGYLLYFGGNTVSTDNIALSIQGPTTIAGGDMVPFSLTLTNKNSSVVHNVTVEVNFPTGTRSADDVLTEYPRYVENVGTLVPGQTVTRSVRAILFGAEGQMLALPVSVSFGTENSNATFVKHTAYTLAVTSAPLSLSVQAPSETVSGQPVAMVLTVRSNAKTPLSNVVVAGEYPFGFVLATSSPPSKNGTFALGVFKPGETKKVNLIGTLTGTTNGHRVFHFTVGIGKSANDAALAVSYMTQEADILITSSFIATALSINGERGEAIVLTPGSPAQASLSYVNTLTTAVKDAAIEVQIRGGSVNYDSIETSNGFYRSADHTIVFGRDTDSALAVLQPSASGLGTFSFSLLPSGTAPRESSVTFVISVSGTRVGQTNVPEQVVSSQVVTAKVASAVVLAARSLYASGPFANTGPIPPKPDVTTSYTVVWNVKSTTNAIAGATVSTVLPSYVSFTKQSTPAGGVSYNSSTRRVTWNVGDLGTGASAEGAFQVALTPSTSQRGTAPALTGPTTFSGYDRFAGIKISAQVDAITTETTGDPGYVSGNADVQ